MTVSKPVAISVIVGVCLLLGLGVWWKSATGPADARSYSENTARQEADPAFQRAEEAQREAQQRNPEAFRAAREAVRDQEYQPEFGR